MEKVIVWQQLQIRLQSVIIGIGRNMLCGNTRVPGESSKVG
jgi:hypothetical protein